MLLKRIIDVGYCTVRNNFKIINIYSYWSDFLYVKISLQDYAILGAVNGVLAIMSDLIESFMKRCSMVKVTPNLILTLQLGFRNIFPRTWRFLRQIRLNFVTTPFHILVYVKIFNLYLCWLTLIILSCAEKQLN